MKFAQHKNRPAVYQRANELRKSGPVIEKILRRALQVQSKSFNIRFRYQHTIDPYIVDFACLSARLIIEIDGMSHESSQNYDEARQHYLEQQGFRVQRFTNADVMKDPAAVAVTVYELAKKLQNLRREETPPRAG